MVRTAVRSRVPVFLKGIKMQRNKTKDHQLNKMPVPQYGPSVVFAKLQFIYLGILILPSA